MSEVFSMKLKQVWQNKQCRLAIETEHGCIDVAAESSRRGISAPLTMLEAIHAGEAGLAVLKQLTVNPQCFTDAPAAPSVYPPLPSISFPISSQNLWGFIAW